LNYYEVLDYKRSKLKTILYKITNYIGLTNKNFELAEFIIEDIKNLEYYTTPQAIENEIPLKRNADEYRTLVWTSRPKFTFSLPKELSYQYIGKEKTPDINPFKKYINAVINGNIDNIPIEHNGEFNTISNCLNMVDKNLRIEGNTLTLYVRDIMVDGKLHTIKFVFDVDDYEENYLPLEYDINKLGQNELVNFISNVNNYKMLTKISSIEAGKVIKDENGFEKYETDEYRPSIEEMIMFSDYAIKKYGINLKTYFQKKLENYERTELQAFYDKSQLLNYIDPKTIFNEAAADNEDDIKPKAVKTCVRKKKEELKKETAEEKVIKGTKVKVAKTTTKTTKKKDEKKQETKDTLKKKASKKTVSKKKKED
jgi:hypothetical protein